MLGLVAPMATEARPLTGERRQATGTIFSLASGGLVCVSGIGERRAQQAAERLLAAKVDGLISWGVAGGLDPSLRPGALVLAERVVRSGEVYRADRLLHAELMEALKSLNPTPGPLCCTGTVVDTVEAKRRVFSESGASAVDMESAAVARLAAEHGVPFAALRVVCDPAELALPRAALAAVDPDGGARPIAFLAALARRPGQLGDLLSLRRSFRTALDVLEQVARLLRPRLAAKP